MSETKTEVKPVAEPEKMVEKKVVKKEEPMLAIVLVRGLIGVNKEILDTLSMLSLHRRNFCSIQKATPSVMGMIKKAKDYITWGEVSKEVLDRLLKERSEPNPKDEKKTKKFFRLNSPKNGYGKKGIKLPFVSGGALGNRGDLINDLIVRML